MSSLDVMLNSAFEAYNNGDYEQAEILARDVLNAEPAHGDALYLLGLIAYQANALEPAVDLLYQAVKLYPQVESYQLLLASILQKQGRLDEALSYYDKFPNNPMALSQKGFIYLFKNQDSFAESSFQKALSLQANLSEAVLGCAQSDVRSGHLDEAIFRLEKQVEQIPHPDLLAYLASLYRQKGEPDKALSKINQAIELIDNASFEIEKGLILEQLGRFSEATQAYRTAIDIDPYRADVWTNLGNVYRRVNDVSAAEDAYKRALQQDLNYVEAHHNLAVLLYEQERLPEALEHYRSVLAQHPNYLPSIYNLAVIEEETGDELEALGLYFNVLSQNGQFPDLDFRIADTLTSLFRRGKKERRQALDFAKGWVKNFPDNPIAIHTYAALRGKKEKGIPIDYAKRLYDSFADTYDNRMRQLQSKAVDELIKLLPLRNYHTILDLGCGTGAFGKAFFKKGMDITGVDFSKNMLHFAESSGVYNQLQNSDVISFFKTAPQSYDLIVAVELLEYLPDMASFCSAISTHLDKEGIFAFSVETTEQDDVVLSESGRYVYRVSFIESCLEKAGLSVIKMHSLDLRREGDGFAKGQIILVTPRNP